MNFCLKNFVTLNIPSHPSPSCSNLLNDPGTRYTQAEVIFFSEGVMLNKCSKFKVLKVLIVIFSGSIPAIEGIIFSTSSSLAICSYGKHKLSDGTFSLEGAKNYVTIITTQLFTLTLNFKDSDRFILEIKVCDVVELEKQSASCKD